MEVGNKAAQGKGCPALEHLCVKLPPMPLQAVTIGPMVMAGLTHSAHTTLAAPSQADDMVRELPASDFNSLRVVGRTAPELFLGHDGTQLLLGVAHNSGQMLDASFRIVPALGG